MTVVVDSLGGVAVSLDPNPQSASFMTVGSAIKKSEGKEGGRSLGPLLKSSGSEKATYSFVCLCNCLCPGQKVNIV